MSIISQYPKWVQKIIRDSFSESLKTPTRCAACGEGSIEEDSIVFYRDIQDTKLKHGLVEEGWVSKDILYLDTLASLRSYCNVTRIDVNELPSTVHMESSDWQKIKEWYEEEWAYLSTADFGPWPRD